MAFQDFFNSPLYDPLGMNGFNTNPVNLGGNVGFNPPNFGFNNDLTFSALPRFPLGDPNLAIDAGLNTPVGINPNNTGAPITEDFTSGVPNLNIPREPELTPNRLEPRGLTPLPNTRVDSPFSNDPNFIEGTTDPVFPIDTQEQDRLAQLQYLNLLGISGFGLPSRAFRFGQFLNGAQRGQRGATLGAVSSGLGLGLGLTRQVLSGFSNANQYNRVMSDYYRRQGINLRNNFTPVQGDGFNNLFGEDGGLFDPLSKLPKPEVVATGEYNFGLPPNMSQFSNIELEDGEYTRDVTGVVQRVVGNKHEDGGVLMHYEEPVQVLSDNLKVGKGLSKALNRVYGIKSKKNDTYSDALDKYTHKIGLDMLTEDQTKVFSLMKEQEDVKNEATAMLNLEYLSGKSVELENRRDILETKRANVFDGLFFEQEEYKKTPEYAVIARERQEEQDEAFRQELDNFREYKESILN